VGTSSDDEPWIRAARRIGMQPKKRTDGSIRLEISNVDQPVARPIQQRRGDPVLRAQQGRIERGPFILRAVADPFGVGHVDADLAAPDRDEQQLAIPSATQTADAAAIRRCARIDDERAVRAGCAVSPSLAVASPISIGRCPPRTAMDARATYVS